MRSSPIYKPSFLTELLPACASSLDGDKFAEFQGKSLLEMVSSSFFDFLAVNAFHLKSTGFLDGSLTSFVYNVDQAVIPSYENNLLHDDFTPMLFGSPGTAMFNNAVRPMDDWETRPIYTEHCNLFDYGEVCEVAFSFPFHKHPKIVIFISKEPGQRFPYEISEEQVEYLFFPFYLGWLRVMGLVDQSTLLQWMRLLSGMTLARFRVLRSLFEPKPWNLKGSAMQLGLSDAAIYRHIEGAFEHLVKVEPTLQSGVGSANRLVELSKAYSFFSFAPGEIRRTLPRKTT